MPTNIGPKIGIEGEAEYRKQLQNIIQSTKTLDKEMKTLESSFNKNTSAQEKCRAKADLLKKQIEQQEKVVSQCEQALRASEQMYGENATTTLKWRSALADARTELNSLNNELSENSKLKAFASDLSDAGDKMITVGNKISKVGETMTKTVTLPIVAAGTAAATMAMDFETAMAKVETIADTGEEPIGDLRNAIMELSDQTGVSASEIAESVYSAISAGQSTGEAVNFVTNATMLAKAGFSDTTTTVDLLTTVLNSYGLKADEVEAVSDKLIQTQNLGKTTIDELGASMGQVIPTASMYGVNLDNLAAAYVTTTKNGIGTAESTTYINSMLAELGTEGTDVSKILKRRTGKSFKELMESGNDLGDVLGILQDEADETGQSVGDMFSSKTATRAAAVLTQHTQDFDSAMQSLGSSTGATKNAFDTMSDTTSNKLQIALNSIKNTGITIGESLLPTISTALESIVPTIQDLTKKWNGLNSKQQGFITKAAAVAAAAGPVTTAVGSVTSGIGGAVKRFSSLVSWLGETEIGLTALPLAATVIGVGALTAAIIDSWDATKEINDTYGDFFDRLNDSSDATTTLTQSFDDLTNSIEERAENFTTAGSNLDYWKTKLGECVDSEGHVKEGCEDMVDYILNELNTAMGTDYHRTAEGFIEDNSGVQKSYADICGEIDNFILKMKAQAVQQAFNENYAQAIQNQADAQKNYNDAVDLYAEALKNAQEAQAEYNRLGEQAEKESQQIGQVTNETATAMAQQKQVLDACNEAWETAGTNLTEASGNLAGTTEEVNGLDTAMSLLSEGTEESAQKAVDCYAQVATNAKDAKEDAKEVAEDLIGELNDLDYKKFDTNYKKAFKGYTDNADKYGRDAAKRIATNLSREKYTANLSEVEVENAVRPAAELVGKWLHGPYKGEVDEVTGGKEAADNAFTTMSKIVSQDMTGNVSSVDGMADAAKSAQAAAQGFLDSHPVTGTVSAVTGGRDAGKAAALYAQGALDKYTVHGNMSGVHGVRTATGIARGSMQDLLDEHGVYGRMNDIKGVTAAGTSGRSVLQTIFNKGVSGTVDKVSNAEPAANGALSTMQSIFNWHPLQAIVNVIGNIFGGKKGYTGFTASTSGLTAGRATRASGASVYMPSTSTALDTIAASPGSFGISPDALYAAVKAGMQDANIGIYIGEREAGRILRGLGVSIG